MPGLTWGEERQQWWDGRCGGPPPGEPWDKVRSTGLSTGCETEGISGRGPNERME